MDDTSVTIQPPPFSSLYSTGIAGALAIARSGDRTESEGVRVGDEEVAAGVITSSSSATDTAAAAVLSASARTAAVKRRRSLSSVIIALARPSTQH